jgi:cytoskeletal protein CcmA (bactofilin family)
MAEGNNEFPTILGPDARFKGELTFDRGVRIEGSFDGQIKSKGTLHIAEGAKVSASVEAAGIRVEGECKGNLTATEKLQLLATAKMEGDIRANRLEIADGAIFIGNVTVGQAAGDASIRRSTSQMDVGSPVAASSSRSGHDPVRVSPQAPRAQAAEIRAAG